MCLINASDLSDARFHRNVKLGRMFRARSINPFERGRPVCGGRGCYANSMVGRSGVEVRGGCAAERKTRHNGPMSWLPERSSSKSAVEEAGGRNLLGGKV